jgi:hypothetical protein
MKRMLIVVAVVVAGCDDRIPGTCEVDDDCPAKLCYRGVCMAPPEDAGSDDGGSDDAGPACTSTSAKEPNCGDGADDDCDGLSDCADPDCADRVCVHTTGECSYSPKASGASCNDANDCTLGDHCDGSGHCVGTAITCSNDTGTCGAVRTCNGTAACAVMYPGTSTSCDDGSACTYGDHCDGSGHCAGTAITCSNEGGTCGAVRTCNGTAACAVMYPGTSTSCDDGNACTYGDRCDGSGHCAGTAITCSNDTGNCGAVRSCNGTAMCDVAYPGTSTNCDDGNACTYGDRCDGSGHCAATAITCSNDTGTCGAMRSCNGTATCTVAYPGTSTNCDDGKACTYSDHCNGAGACVGTSYSCTGECLRGCDGTGGCIFDGGAPCSCGTCTGGRCVTRCTVNRKCCSADDLCIGKTQYCP